MNIIKIILYPSPLAPFFGNEEDLKLRCKLEWPKLGLYDFTFFQLTLWPSYMSARMLQAVLNQNSSHHN